MRTIIHCQQDGCARPAHVRWDWASVSPACSAGPPDVFWVRPLSRHVRYVCWKHHQFFETLRMDDNELHGYVWDGWQLVLRPDETTMDQLLALEIGLFNGINLLDTRRSG